MEEVNLTDKYSHIFLSTRFLTIFNLHLPSIAYLFISVIGSAYRKLISMVDRMDLCD